MIRQKFIYRQTVKIGRLLWLVVFLCATASAQSELQLNQPLGREIKKDETLVFKINAASGDFFRVVVRQKNADVSLKLLSPKSETLVETDNSNSTEEPERISFIANETGEFSIAVSGVRSWNVSSNFEIKLDVLRPSVDKDKSQIEAEKLYNKAIYFAWFSEQTDGKELAVKAFNESLPFFQTAQDRFGEAFVFYYLGILYYRLNLFQMSIENSAKSANIFREIKALPQLAVVLSNEAAVHYKFQELKKSEDLSKEALEIYRVLNDKKNIAKVGGNLALISASYGNNREAIKRFEEILPIFQAENDRSNEAWVFNNIGSIYDDLGEPAKALEFLEKALKIRLEISQKAQQAVTLVNLGSVYRNLKQPQKAIEYLNQALALFVELGNEVNQAACLNNLGEVYNDLGDYQKAQEFYTKSLELNRKFGHQANEAGNLKNLAQLSVKLGKLDEALDFQAKNLEIIENQRTKISQRDLQTKFFASKQDNYEFYIDLLMKRHKTEPNKGFDALALQASERGRARNLLQSIGEIELREGIPPELLAKEKDLRRKLNLQQDLRQQLIAGNASKDRVAGVEKRIEEILRELYDIWAKMRESSPKFAGFTEPKPLNLTEIQQKILDEDTVLLEYALGTERSYLFVAAKNSLKVFELPKRTEIESLARIFYDSLKTSRKELPNETERQTEMRLQKTDAELARTSAELGKILLAPVADAIENKRLLIVGAEVLQYIPFAALKNPKSNAQYLIETNEIINLPSASTLAVLRNAPRKSATKDLAIFADPIFDISDERLRQIVKQNADSTSRSQFARLVFSGQEAENIALFVPSEKRFTAVGLEANLNNLRKQDLSQFRILHFATHSLLDSRFNELSGVVLSLIDEKGNAQDGIWRLNEIYNLRLNAGLVVLSACETALGTEIRGEGLVGFTHAFMYSGAKSVVASLWLVDDRPTSKLMQRFYQAMLKENLPPSKALQKAQISMIKEKGLDRPFYWSAFTLQGDWR